MTNEIGRNLERAASSAKELGDAISKPGEFAKRGMAKYKGAIERSQASAKEAFDKLDEHAKAADAEFDKAWKEYDAAGKTNTPPSELEALRGHVVETLDAWAKANAAAEKVGKHLSVLDHALANAEAGSQLPGRPDPHAIKHEDSAEDESGEHESAEHKLRETEDKNSKARDEVKDLQKEIPKLEEEAAHQQSELDQAKQRAELANKQSAAAVDKLKAEPANADKQTAADKLDEHDANKKRADELHKKAGRIRHAENERKAAQAALEPVMGHKVEVGGSPGEIAGFTPDGVLVKPAGGAEGPPQVVAADQIKGPGLPGDFVKQANRLATAKTGLETDTQGEVGGTPNNIANELDKNAASLDRRVQADYGKGGSKKQAKWAETKRLGGEWKAEVDEANEPAKDANAEVDKAQKELDKTKTERDEKKDKLKDAAKEVDDTTNEARSLRREKGVHRRSELAMEKFPELVFEKLKELKEWLFGGEEEKKKEGEEGKTEKPEKPDGGAGENAPAPVVAGAPGEGTGAPAPTGAARTEGGAPTPAPKKIEKPEGATPESKKKEGEGGGEEEKAYKEALALGKSKVMLDALVAMPPPPEIERLGEQRQKATAAAERAKTFHAAAYTAYQGEIAVTQLAAQSKQMSEDGKPMQKRAQGMRAPIEKSKGDEAQRQATIGGAQPGDVKGADSRMSGLVMTMISKIGSHSDRLSNAPSAGGASGDNLAGGQDKAAGEANARTNAGKGQSKQQAQFLDQASDLRNRQETSMQSNITALENKHNQELGSRDKIRANKASALAQEQAARQEAESEASAFNAGLRDGIGVAEELRSEAQGSGELRWWRLNVSARAAS